MLFITQTALELGFMYALVSMALYLSYRVLDIADLTTDGSFVLGTAVAVSMAAAGHPLLAFPAAMAAGAGAGFVTAFLQTRLGVPSILAGIITNTGLYTINLMAMGWTSNVNLLKQAALMDPLTGAVCNPPEIWQMIDEMLIAQEEWLPQYKEAIADAKKRCAEGPLLPTRDGYQCAGRIRDKTVEEITAERENRTITA